MDTATLTAIAFHPLTIMIGTAAVGFAATWAIKAYPREADAAADYLEAVELAVVAAERTGYPGAAKLRMAIDKVEAWMAANGVVGDAREVTLDRMRADIEAARVKLFPKK